MHLLSVCIWRIKYYYYYYYYFTCNQKISYTISYQLFSSLLLITGHHRTYNWKLNKK